jgi:hypothetical protein
MGATMWHTSSMVLLLASTAIAQVRAQDATTRSPSAPIVSILTVQVPAFYRVVVDPGRRDSSGLPNVKVITNVPALRRSSAGGIRAERVETEFLGYRPISRSHGGMAGVEGEALIRYTVTSP